mgnify:CR=1 FL=1
MACDPLPDVDRETDLNTFITQWRETEDPDVAHAANFCQIAEDVIRSMQSKLGEAKAMFQTEQEQWCKHYIKMLRDIELRKFDEVSAKVMEFMDVHTKLSPAELQKAQDSNKRGAKGYQTRKQTFKIVEERGDILFGIYAKVMTRSIFGDQIDFGNYSASLPQKQASI